MVALKQGLPLIRNDRGVAVTFESDWLKAAVDRAARKAGYDGWWLLDEFSSAVAQYLRHDYSHNVIELPSLEKVVRATLRDIGYREIAVRFRAVNPFQCMSLADCVRATDLDRETAFFKRLAERITRLHEAKVQHFHFHDLHLSARQLLGTKGVQPWIYPLMRARIVTFVRAQVEALPWRWKMQCTIR